MKKILVVYIMFLTTSLPSLCQTQRKEITNDLAVYRCILLDPNPFETSKYPIDDSTYLRTLQRIDFKNEDLSTWDKKFKTIKGWKDFFKQIDISKLKTAKIHARKIGAYPVRHTDMKELKNDPSKSVYKFSPVIYSKNKSLAVCTKLNLGWENFSEAIYLLRFNGKKWEIMADRGGIMGCG